MKNRRKMYHDIYPQYSPGHMPVFNTVIYIIMLLLGVLFFAFRYSVMSPQETQESLKKPVEVQQKASRTPESK